MDVPVNDHIRLTEIRDTDKPALVRHLVDKEIYNWTLRIPHSYTEAHAEEWLDIVAQDTRRLGRPVSWAIRDQDDLLIGAVGLDGLEVGHSFRSHRAEIGYWLARPYWGRGIMTEVVRVACDYGFREFGLLRITAHVFADNAASACVLEKCGFQCEAPLMRKLYLKDGRFLDGRLYALVR